MFKILKRQKISNGGKQKFVDETKTLLKKRKEELEKQLEEIAQKNPEEARGYETKFPDFGQSEDENADEVASFIDSLSLEENLETNLAEVNLALKKIQKGEYGLCEECHQEIGRDRLSAFPTARWCLDCKNKLSK